MKKNLLIAVVLLIGGRGSQHLAAQSLDPQFGPPTLYGVGTVSNAIEQPDGKRLVIGEFRRVNGTSTASLVRLTAAGALDQPFQQNLGALDGAYKVALQANGQLLVTTLLTSPITAGGITRSSAIRLNADGTGDASFSLGTGIASASGYTYIDNLLQLPSGKIIITGAFDHINGVVANNIARLNSDGSLDTTFTPGTGSDAEIESLVLLPSGQLLIGGYFTDYNGSAVNGLARLSATGALDASFSTSLAQYDEVSNLAVQPDGRILASGYLSNGSNRGLVRLLANGSLDNSFATPATFSNFSAYSYYGNAFELQPDGKIVVINAVGVNSAGAAVSRVSRLNSDGSPDTGFLMGTGPDSFPRAVTLLASGKILVSGGFTNFSGTLDRSLIQLNANGTIDAGFQPVIQTFGAISSVVRQPDGKIVVGGSFTEFNGQLIRRLARVNPDGTLDPTFAISSTFEGASNLALQPDGKILALSVQKAIRLLPTGAIDNSFAADFTGSQLSRMLLQPDGKILVAATGSIILNGAGTNSMVVRLQANGSPDATFATVPPVNNSLSAVYSMALQPNGKVLIAGIFAGNGSFPTAIQRLESTGAVDATFTRSVFEFASRQSSAVYALTVQPDGKILVGGNFDTNWGASRRSLSRLNADGTLDTGFTPPPISGYLYSLLVQPNNRILLGGTFTSATLPSNLARVLANGQADASFGNTATPNGIVRALLVQPDGNLVVGGGFSSLSGQPSVGLARITASNVLHVAAPQAVAEQTLAWPVPATGVLNVAFDLHSHPQALALVNALGRTMRQQVLNGAAPVALPLETLRAGIYLLRVTYAEGTVTRRVQVQ
ncbi:putative delta-60 repeat protein [Hymenobacter sp. UYAg731]